ncbi:amino acid adenylation domain-containing protein [Microbulbifer sp. THAF38]|uniref:amino acid adenylation domain-containing protein n=1 Tax=Microbulbifer sp. THAF38 TaxID=2587856 RepID=UPI00126983A5|nr:amino acid adenylation domain-containing protein [Microbulbifer sp. THAF38]QFT53928.1 Linear gramicidin synthase subunit B [Microbulbifer sp. THAF38]
MSYNNIGALLVHELVEIQAQIASQNIAVKYKEHELTYGELNQKADLFANYLKSTGVNQDDVVALSMKRSFEVIIAMLAILKCGAAYLPIDDRAPLAITLKNLSEASVKHIVSTGDCSGLLEDDRQAIEFKDYNQIPDVEQTQLAVITSRVNKHEARCYVMFTSGSTGEPKGVQIPHRAVVRLVKDTNYIKIKVSDTIFQFAPLSFDASTFEIWGALCSGATLALYSGVILDPKLFYREIKDNKVTILWLTAALFHLIATRYINVLSTVNVVLAGGDVLYPKMINKLLETYPEITVINGYGPTENTTFTCCHRMTHANRPNSVVPIGKAITGTEVFILDGHLKPVDEGDVGELVVAGLGVSLGYLNNKSDSFFENSSIAGGLLYKTGDLVKRNVDGDIEFVGRKDNQVKIRGYRVSLEAIQNSLLEVEHVDEAVVLLEQHDTGEQLLIAFLKIAKQSDLTARDIKQYLTTKIADYMIPEMIEFCSELPITKNGKIDKKSLKK